MFEKKDGERWIQMIYDLIQNNSYSDLKKAAEDRGIQQETNLLYEQQKERRSISSNCV